MSNPIITNFTQVQQLGSNGSYLLLVDGANFDGSTSFGIRDTSNPQVIWNPSTQHGQILNGGTRAEVSSTPSVPGGGLLPTSGELLLSAFGSNGISPTNSTLSKPFVYQGPFQFSHP
jgi:hypothetical protein